MYWRFLIEAINLLLIEDILNLLHLFGALGTKFICGGNSRNHNSKDNSGDSGGKNKFGHFGIGVEV